MRRPESPDGERWLRQYLQSSSARAGSERDRMNRAVSSREPMRDYRRLLKFTAMFEPKDRLYTFVHRALAMPDQTLAQLRASVGPIETREHTAGDLIAEAADTIAEALEHKDSVPVLRLLLRPARFSPPTRG